MTGFPAIFAESSQVHDDIDVPRDLVVIFQQFSCSSRGDQVTCRARVDERSVNELQILVGCPCVFVEHGMAATIDDAYVAAANAACMDESG